MMGSEKASSAAPVASDMARDTNDAVQKLFQISELKLIIFHHMSDCDLMVATQVCKEWQDLIVCSTALRNRFLHVTLPFQYAAIIYQSERASRTQSKPASRTTTQFSGLPQDRDYFFHVPQTALVNGECHNGTLIIFHCGNLHIKLPTCNDPGFQLAKSAKAYLFADEILYWGPSYRMPGCKHMHLPRSRLIQVVSGQSLEQKDYFDEHFANMLQKDMCDDEYCFWETGQYIERELENEEVTQAPWWKWVFMGFL